MANASEPPRKVGLDSWIQGGLALVLIAATWRAGVELRDLRDEQRAAQDAQRDYADNKFVDKEWAREAMGRLGDRVGANEQATRDLTSEVSRLREFIQGRPDAGMVDR